MTRFTCFSYFSLLALILVLNSCDGGEVDITNTDIDPPMIEVEAGTFNYTINGVPVTDTGLSFVCRTDSVGILSHRYAATNADVSGLSDTNFVAPVLEGDVVVQGYTEDVTNISYTSLLIMVEIGGGTLEAAACSDCPITMTEDGSVLTGTFSGTLTTSNPDSVFVITDGTFEVPLIELNCE